MTTTFAVLIEDEAIGDHTEVASEIRFIGNLFEVGGSDTLVHYFSVLKTKGTVRPVFCEDWDG